MAKDEIKSLRDFPAIEQLLVHPQLSVAVSRLPRPVAADLLKAGIARQKEQFRKKKEPSTQRALLQSLTQELRAAAAREVRRVINAAGVVVHTNLGRAPLSAELFDAIRETACGYGNIEFDLASGVRGTRGVACEQYLATLCGAEAGTVVNNCAAALFVILNTLANRKRVVISRGELVQIGGGFRIPDILRRSGAKLAEVGTTNITTLADYRSEIDTAALVLKVHKSNFRQAGFTEEAELKPLVQLCREKDVPLVNDLGSGVLIPTKEIIGFTEPTVQQSVRSGADLTCFSGDKMLGGVQAGLIVGRADLVQRIKKNPIFRTVRVDKLVLAALERMLSAYLNQTHLTDIKLWAVLSIDPKTLKQRAKRVMDSLGNPSDLSLVESEAFVGGGALPEQGMCSFAIKFSSQLSAEKLMRRFREMEPPIIGRIQDDCFLLDFKTIDEADLDLVIEAIRTALDA